MSEGHVYLLQSERTQWYKIGYSKDPRVRVGQLNKELEGLDWRFVAAIKTNDVRRLERAFHEAFATRRITKGKEWFTLGAVELELFKALAETVDVAGRPFVPPEQLASEWRGIIEHMKRNRQAPTAAVYEELIPIRFVDGILTLEVPEDLAIYGYMAKDDRHVAALRQAASQVFDDQIIEVRTVYGPAE